VTGTSGERARPIGPWSLLALGINGIVGVGIFFAPSAIAAVAPGESSVAVMAVTGVGLIPVALALAAIGSRFDEDGGPVVYARAAFGEGAGFIVGWLAYVAAVLSMSTVMTGLTQALLPGAAAPWVVSVAAIGVVTVLSLVASSGIGVSARVWTTLTAIKLLPLVALALAATFLLASRAPAPAAAGEGGVTDWSRAMLTATFVYQGFEVVPVVAGQVEGGRRAIPVALLGSLLLSTALYLALQRAAVAATPDLAHSGAPLVATAEACGGAGFARVVAVGTSVSAVGIAFGMVATTPRYLSALVPRSRLAELSPGGVPLRALWTTWLVVSALVSMGSFGELLVLSSLSVVTQYLVVALALARLALRRERGLTPLRAWSAAPTVLVACFLLRGASRREWVAAAGWTLAGLVVHAVVSRRRAAA
jgi:amino acid transporter